VRAGLALGLVLVPVMLFDLQRRALK